MSTGPDFSSVDSKAKAEQLAEQGLLEKLFLLPPEFGGQDLPENIVYVPLGLADAKRGFDLNVVRPAIAEGKVTQYAATPEYSGVSFIPIEILIVASDPGSVTMRLAVWGDALQRNR